MTIITIVTIVTMIVCKHYILSGTIIYYYYMSCIYQIQICRLQRDCSYHAWRWRRPSSRRGKTHGKTMGKSMEDQQKSQENHGKTMVYEQNQGKLRIFIHNYKRTFGIYNQPYRNNDNGFM